MKKILEGIKVLDLTQAYSGPFACMHLADCGAEVIKIEPPHGDQTRAWNPLYNDYSGYFAYLNRNKLGLSLDLKTEEGKDILRKLIKEADVVIENFKVGTFAKLGFSYEKIKEINPQIIYGQITGFGLAGPLSSRPAYDIVAQAESGMMSLTGYAENDPVKIGPSVADSFTGTYLALAVMMALFNRARTGMGCHVNVAMLDTMFSTMEAFVPFYTLLGKTPERTGNTGTSLAPWDLFRAHDGFFVMGCGTDKHWQVMSKVMGLDDLTDNPDYCCSSKRVERNAYIKQRIEEITMEMSLTEVEEKLTTAGIPFGRVNDIAQCTESEQIKVRNMIWEIYDPGLDTNFKMPGTPMKFDHFADTITSAAPMLGQHSAEILKGLGYSEREIASLKENGVLV